MAAVIKHFALGIHCAPKIDHAAGDFQIDRIQMPGGVWLGSTFAQVRRDHGLEMNHPTPNGLVGLDRQRGRKPKSP